MAELGCGDHKAAIYDRCEGQKLVDLDDITALSWGRALDTYSSALVTVGRAGSCCDLLTNMRSWRHELVIWRNNRQVWSGPIVRPVFGAGETTIAARDRWAWLDFRAVRADMTLTGDLTDIAVKLIEHGLTHPDGDFDDETCILAFLEAIPSGVYGSRDFKALQSMVGAELRNLTRGPLNATFLGRRLVLFGPKPLSRTAMLQDKDFMDELTVVEDGLSAVTRAYVAGQTVTATAGGTDPYYGLLEQIYQDQTVTTQFDAQTLAQAQVDTNRWPPLVISVPDGVQLAPDAPVDIDELVPGTEVPVWSSATCREVNQNLVLTKLDVTVSPDQGERGAVTLAPGTALSEQLTGSGGVG
ncbi:hypothetical protein QRX50_31655 [Amycolatopsis carbonis]|uniref:Minor tail protein n=1 Tax=Amycolatopsis carbonis TaxID=715471 RepID=A0A9Y2MRY7_9PSEU|nr:hypothetical protein [Amycolatopsis sp. 2-15]WIX76016.1 hypothetical protein QRX50_31655 [Amycolatopsis sp. 2-15]